MMSDVLPRFHHSLVVCAATCFLLPSIPASAAAGAGAPPVIAVDPASQSVQVGDTVAFSVIASGAPPLSYFWRSNGIVIPGATMDTYTITNVQLNHAATYSVIVSNSIDIDISSDAVLTVSTFIALGDAVDAPGLTWSTGGDASWLGQAATTHDGLDAAQSGSITNLQETWMETTVTGPITLSFWWKVSSEAGYDWLRVSLDGGQQFAITGEQGWEQKFINVPAGMHTIRWQYDKDYTIDDGADKGWVDEVTLTVPLTLAEALDNPGLIWVTGGFSNWTAESSPSHDGVDAAQTGPISHEEYTILQTSVDGPGTVTFWWKVSSDAGYDFLDFYVNSYLSNCITGEQDWTPVSVPLPPGTHLLQWAYLKDDFITLGEDKGWVDQVVFIASSQILSNGIAGSANGPFQFQFSGTPGGSYTVEGSTNFFDWVTVSNLISVSSPMTFIDPGATNFRSRYYRVKSP